jgi:hypothetical protein
LSATASFDVFELVDTDGHADDLYWGFAKLCGTSFKAKDGDMNGSQVSEYESGYFHLTQNGWTRKDSKPPPPDRLETWKYQLERPAPDAKDEVTLARVWISKDLTDAQSIALHERHGEAVLATRDRNVVLESYV